MGKYIPVGVHWPGEKRQRLPTRKAVRTATCWLYKYNPLWRSLRQRLAIAREDGTWWDFDRYCGSHGLTREQGMTRLNPMIRAGRGRRYTLRQSLVCPGMLTLFDRHPDRQHAIRWKFRDRAHYHAWLRGEEEPFTYRPDSWRSNRPWSLRNAA